VPPALRLWKAASGHRREAREGLSPVAVSLRPAPVVYAKGFRRRQRFYFWWVVWIGRGHKRNVVTPLGRGRAAPDGLFVAVYTSRQDDGQFVACGAVESPAKRFPCWGLTVGFSGSGCRKTNSPPFCLEVVPCRTAV
jgi:hypothetical protein